MGARKTGVKNRQGRLPIKLCSTSQAVAIIVVFGITAQVHHFKTPWFCCSVCCTGSESIVALLEPARFASFSLHRRAFCLNCVLASIALHCIACTACPEECDLKRPYSSRCCRTTCALHCLTWTLVAQRPRCPVTLRLRAAHHAPHCNLRHRSKKKTMRMTHSAAMDGCSAPTVCSDACCMVDCPYGHPPCQKSLRSPPSMHSTHVTRDDDR